MAIRTESHSNTQNPQKDQESGDRRPKERQCSDCAFTGPSTQYLNIGCPEGCYRSHQNTQALKEMSIYNNTKK